MFFSDIETASPIVFFGLCKYRNKYWKRKDIENYQEKKLNDITYFAFNNSPFFHSLYRNFNLNDFFHLPTVNKQIMMDNFSDYNSLGLMKEEVLKFALEVESKRDFSHRLGGITVGMSSGTSGNKGLVLTSRREELYLKSMYLSRLVLPPRQKVVCAFILRVSSPAFRFNAFGNSLTYIDQLQTTEKIIAQIDNIHPNVIAAPPSMLQIIASEYEQGNLHVNPALVYSYAEVLYPDVKQYIRRIFDCEIHEIYQGSEGYYAMTCKEGRLHINEDMVYLELYNFDGSPTIVGNPCYQLLVTDLHKRSQPIIRYELNDIITLSRNRCSCGSCFRVIESIQGRADDLFWGLRKKDNHKQLIYPDFIARKIISISDKIQDYQATQNNYMDVMIRLKLSEQKIDRLLIEKIKAGIQEVFSAYECILPKVTVEIGEPEKNLTSNKLIRIRCNIKEKMP